MEGGPVMKKVLLLTLIIFLCIGSFGFSQNLDFGGTIDSLTSLSITEEASLFNQEKLSLWFTAGGDTGLKFNAQGSYTFTTERPYLFDVDYLNLAGNWLFGEATPMVFSFKAGRFYSYDFTGYVYSHTADGLSLSLGFPFMTINLSGFFTGLMLKPNSTITMSNADQADQSDDSVVLGPKRIAALATVGFPELFLKQDITVSGIFQFDLRPDADVGAGEGKVTTQYVGAGLGGPIVPALYWNSFFYLGLGTSTYASGNYLGFLTGGGIRYFNKNLLSTRVELKTMVGSGDADADSYVEGNTSGQYNAFTPVSKTSTGYIFSPALTNIWITELNYSFKLFMNSKSEVMKNFQYQTKWIVFFRPTLGPISASGLQDASEAYYLGTEIDHALNFRPLSDFGVAISWGLFLPSERAFYSSVRKAEGVLRLEASLSF